MKNELLTVLMERDELTAAEAWTEIKEMRRQVCAGEDPEQILFDNGLEPDYIFDII